MSTEKIDVYRPTKALTILGLVICLFSGASCIDREPREPRDRAPSAAPLPVKIQWSMAERFGPGYDLNRNGRPDLPNSYEYVNPGEYEVRLHASVEAAAADLTGMSCNWTIDRPDQTTPLRLTGRSTQVRLSPSVYAASVEIRLAGGRTGSARETIRVRDILIAALGDSLATGEGNPEESASWQPPAQGRSPAKPAQWADGGLKGDQPRVTPAGTLLPASQVHTVAHRSTHSALAQLAMRLEAEDPHTSVTFVCLAASGAPINDLFTSDRSGRNRARDPGPPLPAQFDELHAILGSRPVDMLFLSVGLNDAGTFPVVGELMRREIQCIDPLRLLAVHPTRTDWKKAQPADWKPLVDPEKRAWLDGQTPEVRRAILAQDVALTFDVAEMAQAGLANARKQLERLTEAITGDPLLARAEIYLMEYPDPAGDADRGCALPILSDLVPGFRVNGRELALAREQSLRPLVKLLGEVAGKRGWICVDGVFTAFQGHGYAAADSWFVKARESELLQGRPLTVLEHLRGQIAPGTLHPNRRGHQVIADKLYEHLVDQKTGRRSSEPGVSSRYSSLDDTSHAKIEILPQSSRGYLGRPRDEQAAHP